MGSPRHRGVRLRVLLGWCECRIIFSDVEPVLHVFILLGHILRVRPRGVLIGVLEHVVSAFLLLEHASELDALVLRRGGGVGGGRRWVRSASRGQTGVEISISRDRNKGGKSEGQCDGAYLCLLGDLRVIRFLRDGRHIQRLVAAG